MTVFDSGIREGLVKVTGEQTEGGQLTCGDLTEQRWLAVTHQSRVCQCGLADAENSVHGTCGKKSLLAFAPYLESILHKSEPTCGLYVTKVLAFARASPVDSGRPCWAAPPPWQSPPVSTTTAPGCLPLLEGGGPARLPAVFQAPAPRSIGKYDPLSPLHQWVWLPHGRSSEWKFVRVPSGPALGLGPRGVSFKES